MRYYSSRVASDAPAHCCAATFTVKTAAERGRPLVDWELALIGKLGGVSLGCSRHRSQNLPSRGGTRALYHRLHRAMCKQVFDELKSAAVDTELATVMGGRPEESVFPVAITTKFPGATRGDQASSLAEGLPGDIFRYLSDHFCTIRDI